MIVLFGMWLKNHLLFSLLRSAGTIFFSAVGKSGNADELLKLIPKTRSKGCFLISVTSVKGNLLEGVCDMNVHLRVKREAGHLGGDSDGFWRYGDHWSDAG